MKRIEVVVGVVSDTNGKVLIGQRTFKDEYYAKWEFPGGKVEPGESHSEALERELKEELGIKIQKIHPLISLHYDYPDRKVNLNVLRVVRFTGDVKSCEGQSLCWVALQDLSSYDMLDGNKAIIKVLIESEVV